MKKNILWIALLLLFASCEKEMTELEVSTPTIVLPSEAGSTTFRISTNKHWNIAMPDTWCQNEIKDGRHSENCYAVNSDFWSRLSAYSGKSSREVMLSVVENQSYHRRRYALHVNAGNLSKQIDVQQEGKPYLEIEYPHYEVAAITSFPSLQIIVYVYDAINVKVESNAEWIGWAGGDMVAVDGKVRYRVDISVASNPSPTPREAILTFTQGSLSKTVTVRQAGAE